MLCYNSTYEVSCVQTVDEESNTTGICELDGQDGRFSSGT